VWDNVAPIVAGVLFVVWPLQYRHSIGRARERIAQHGGDVERFEATMDRRWIRVALRAAPVVGALLIAEGIVSLAFCASVRVRLPRHFPTEGEPSESDSFADPSGGDGRSRRSFDQLVPRGQAPPCQRTRDQ
jgi:hypothetical protein